MWRPHFGILCVFAMSLSDDAALQAGSGLRIRFFRQALYIESLSHWKKRNCHKVIQENDRVIIGFFNDSMAR